MLVTCDSEKLKKTYKIVSKAVTTSGNGTLTDYVMFVFSGDRILLRATNLEIDIISSFDAEGSETGAVLLPGKILNELIPKLNDGKVSFNFEENKVKIASEKSKFTINSLSSENFPSLYKDKWELIFSLDQNTLKKNLQDVLFAAAGPACIGKPTLQGVSLTTSGSNIEWAATDSHMLSISKTFCENIVKDTSGILPAKALQELCKILDGDGNVEIFEGPGRFIFKATNFQFSVSCISGKFPDYRGIIPNTFKNVITLSKTTLKSLLNRVMIIAKDSNGNPPVLKVSLDEGTLLLIEGRSSGGNLAVEEIEYGYSEDNCTDSPISLGFNGAYLLDVISSFAQEDVVFKFNDEMSPSVFTGGEDKLCLLMPYRLTF